MVAGQSIHDATSPPSERAFPPVTEIAVASMALVVVGGVYIAGWEPHSVPLGPAIALLIGATVPLLVNVVILSRLRDFAWRRFFQVFRYALLAYLVIAGMIGYVFIDDGARAGTLVVLVLMLTIYAVDIPTILAFSVARYEDTEGRSGR